jgi:hypothetical protein
MKELTESRKARTSSGSGVDLGEPARLPAQLYSLTLGKLPHNSVLETGRATPSVVDALAASGLPFLELKGLCSIDPAIEAQLTRNQRLFVLGDLKKVPATSLRLFICGDPFAGLSVCTFIHFQNPDSLHITTLELFYFLF